MMKTQNSQICWKPSILLSKLVRPCSRGYVVGWVRWSNAFLMVTSPVLQYSKNWKLFHVQTCQIWWKIENRQSYQKASTFLPRVIPTILMGSWHMLGSLEAFLVNNWHATGYIVQKQVRTYEIWWKLETVKSTGNPPCYFLKWSDHVQEAMT